tara:strand:- start:307 stop:2439 length:2133 start_codon:yes stop_codon:yes gene_type:complete
MGRSKIKMQRPLSGIAISGRWLIVVTIALIVFCCLPALFMVAGVDFGNTVDPHLHEQMFATQEAHAQAMFKAMAGSFLHSILEWSAFSVAVVITLMAMLHYRLNGQSSTPIISLVLLSAGTMDAFHVLVASRLIPSVADNHAFIPFTWALSRFFNAAITIVGVCLLIVTNQRRQQHRTGLIVVTSLLFASIGSMLVLLCARYENLPASIFPDQFISRPWDIPALVLFILASLVIIPSALHKHRNVFLLSIWMSMIPQIATQLYMVFGSRALFDSSFNVAHAIKILAYLMPLGGLGVDYVLMHRQLEQSVRHVTRSRRKLRQKHDHLQAVLVNIGDAVMTVSKTGIVRTANRTTTMLFGYPVDSLRGMALPELLLEMPVSFESICGELAQTTGAVRSAYHFQASGRHTDGHHFDAEVSINRLCERNGDEYVVSVHDCTQIHKVNRELAHARDQAHLAAEARDRLLSNVSFELRTPLNAIVGFSSLLEDELRSLHMAELLEDATEIRHASMTLQSMINEVLDLATINQGKLNVTIAPLELSKLCNEVLHASLGIIEASNNIIHLHSSNQVIIHSDVNRLRQVLFNLVGNAAKLTQDNRIDLYIESIDYQQRPGVTLRIVVGGVILTESQQQLIFEIFGNTSEPAQPIMGSGTGLSLSQRLIDLIGGQITVSCDEQQGTTFHVLLPMDGPELEPIQIEDELDPIEVEVLINER